MSSSYQSRSRIHCSGKQHEFRSLQRVESTSDISIPTGCWVGNTSSSFTLKKMMVEIETTSSFLENGLFWWELPKIWISNSIPSLQPKPFDWENSNHRFIQRKRIPTLHFRMLHMRFSCPSIIAPWNNGDRRCLSPLPAKMAKSPTTKASQQ